MKNRFNLIAKFRLVSGERGFGLAESLICVAIIGTAVGAFILALSTGSIAVGEIDRETVAQRLAQSQIEQTKSVPYSISGAGYATIPAPSGYSISMAVDSTVYTNSNIQKLTVIISENAAPILTVEDYKVNR